MARPRCYETAAEKQKAYRLRKKGLPFLKEEAKPEATILRTEMEPQAITHEDAVKIAHKSTMDALRDLVSKEQEKPATGVPESPDTRSAKDIVGGIYRNDSGGVISKFAWEKLQKMKAHAKANNFEIDDYSQ